MTRQTRLAALALLVVLVSAGGVGSQDPYRARSEAQSAASATPVSSGYSQNLDDPYRGPIPAGYANATPSYQQDDAPPAVAAPQPITPPQHSEIDVADVASTGIVSTPAVLSAPIVDEAVHKQSPRQMTLASSVVEPQLAAVTTTSPELPHTQTLTDSGDDTGLRYDAATRHLLEAVPDEIEGYFDLFMYVSKARSGPLAQRMFVFQRDENGQIAPYAEWRVSTGREKWELHHEKKVRTQTPEGMFMLDPDRFYKRYWSKSWDNAPMHYAMFYDMVTNGRQSGLAIHAAVGKSKIARLGKRDSAGCIRLSPGNAKELFFKVQNTTRGSVPVLAVNERKSTDRWGKVERTETGAVLMQDGYRALLFVENFDGAEETVGPVVAYTH